MVQVDSSDVIRLVLQFLKASDLSSSYEALTKESKVSLDLIHDKDGFLKGISDSKWERVIRDVGDSYFLPHDLFDLFTLMFLDLIAKEEHQAARVILKESAPMQLLKEINRDEYTILEHILLHRREDLTADEMNSRIGSLREQVIDSFRRKLANAPKDNRLLSLINDALKWQLHGSALSPNVRFDLLRGSLVVSEAAADRYPVKIFTSYDIKASAISFHPSGRFCCAGLADGFVMLLDVLTGQPFVDYALADPMAVPDRISCCRFDSAGTTLAVGCADGSVAVWRVENGRTKPLRFFEGVAQEPVLDVEFTADGNLLVSSGHLLLLGMKSGSVLRQIPDLKGAVLAAPDKFVAFGHGDIRTLDMHFSEIQRCPISFTPTSMCASGRGGEVLVDGGVYNIQENGYLLLLPHPVTSMTSTAHFSVFATNDAIHFAGAHGTSQADQILLPKVKVVLMHPVDNILLALTDEKLFLFRS